jgi:hypothetical protein
MSGAAFAMHPAHDQKKETLKQAVVASASNNQNTKSISLASVETAASNANQIATDVSNTATAIEDIAANIESTVASNAKDPEPKKILEDAGGTALDILEGAPALLLAAVEDVAAVKQASQIAKK